MNRTPHTSDKSSAAKCPDTLLTDAQWSTISLALNITPRELQIIQGIFAGLNETLISEQLSISTHTVHTHLDRIYRKLGVSGRCNLVLRIFEQYVASYSLDNFNRSSGMCA